MKSLPPGRSLHLVSITACLILAGLSPAVAGQPAILDNGIVRAVLDNGSLVRLERPAWKQAVEIAGDFVGLELDGKRLARQDLAPGGSRQQAESVVYRYAAGDKDVQVVYELKPGWHFLSKHIRIVLPKGGSCRIDGVEPFSADLKTPIASEHRAAASTGAVFVRLGQPGVASKHGLFLVIQNPQSTWRRTDGHVSVAYTPAMSWQADYGPFESDRVCLGLYERSGLEFPAQNLPEWKYVRDPDHAFDQALKLDWAETEALTRCVAAFLLYRPQKSLRVHVPWCENDYQIDVATPEGRAEWKRILDQCAACGIDHTLFTPGNGAVAPLKDNADAWGWENCLWLGLGQRIRKDQWKIASDPIPASIQEILDYARSKNVSLVAYAYPTLGWKQNPEWTAWCGGRTGGYVGADTGVRSFQDWFVDRLTAFQQRTGVSGYSFDHWWIAYEPNKEGFKPTSKYAQWYGCRRILEELRRRSPDVLIDGRQQYQWFGPWTWLAGSYPHPTTNDEQPGSFKNFPDLHFSRVSADRQRWASWWYRMQQFAPLEVVPGYMTHQTPRNDPRGRCVRDRAFHVRDWDCLGWRYSVISSIGTAPRNHVVDYLPARDEAEFKSFRPADQQWLRHWLDWTDANRAALQNLRPIIGPPVLGRVDGSAAIDGRRGFVFLFNPNYRELNGQFALDASIGLTQGEKFLLRELHPRPGRWHGKPHAGPWRRGDKVSLPIKGPEAVVLEVVPAEEAQLPIVLAAQGQAVMEGDRLTLSGVEGAAGRTVELGVLLPAVRKPAKIALNGREISAFTQQDALVTFPVTFAGAPFDHCQQVGACDRNFADKVFRADFTVPQRVFSQLAHRRKAWPVPYTGEDLSATWRGSDRLLLYVHIADPNDKWDVGLKIDGQPREVKRAYSDVYPLGRERTFTGFYADVSDLKADVRHEVEVALPDGLQPGQFQGLFFENVESEFVADVRGAAGGNAVRSESPSGSAAVGATIGIDLREEKAPVPPTLYGIFMEELSHAFDGGIYGELIQNRSFEEGVLPPGMKLVKKPDGGLKMELEKLPPGVPQDKWDMPWPWNMGCAWDPNRALIGWSLRPDRGATGTMAVTDAHPMNAASSRSLQMTVNAAGEGCVDLVNSGYWGVNIRAKTPYRLKFHLYPGSFRGTVTAMLEGHDGKPLGSHDFGPFEPGQAWQPHTATLEATGTDPKGRFVLRFRGQGTLQVDWVSLFPPTYKARPNGLRPDLAQYLQDLKPAFIRYPGGCYVEGHSFEGAPDWRTMVCPPDERPGTWSCWQYRSTDGFGYHEFLQFCEDVGADALYVSFAGMTCHPENNWPLDKLDPIIQRTLDAIEYAVGPVDSKWGAARARMGHPAAFPLKYVEIGNEHPPAIYGDYYKRFRTAIKAKYPHITVIMSMFWSGLNPDAIRRAGDDQIDVVDEHSYRPSGWIRNNFDYFDKYPRKPWKIYVGEYAHHHGSGDWSAAMDDSVYLMMLERNGDLVKMASYAPLLVNVNHRSWGVNLIEFDSSRSFAHASYYVQKTFGETRPDVNLAARVDIQPKPDPNRPLLAGRLGLGAWNTHNEFKEFRIHDDQGKLVFSDDFQSMNHWDAPGVGQWKATRGVLAQTDQGKGPAMLLLKKDFTIGRVSVKARRVDGNEGFLIFFHAAGIDRYMFCNYGAAGNQFSAIQGTPCDGIATKGGGDRQGPIEKGRWYDISLVVTRNSAEMLLDGKRVSRIEAEALPCFFATAGYSQKEKSVIVRATNYHPVSVPLTIDLEHARSVGQMGEHTILRADDPTAENTLEEPLRIRPRKRPLGGCGKRFTVEVPSRSVNVLRIPVQP